MTTPMDLTGLLTAYRSGATRPSEVVEGIFARIDACASRPIWIALCNREETLARARKLESSADKTLPLFGIPFAVKDNIDVAGMDTTAGCPGYAYRPDSTAPVVQRLLDAGAILIGKTNLDQFATGLVGTRSPYGACASAFDDRYISGGSSSGSALAVARALVTFALGTDTAGSGRVPAAFSNIVGLKPTRRTAQHNRSRARLPEPGLRVDFCFDLLGCSRGFTGCARRQCAQTRTGLSSMGGRRIPVWLSGKGPTGVLRR